MTEKLFFYAFLARTESIKSYKGGEWWECVLKRVLATEKQQAAKKPFRQIQLCDPESFNCECKSHRQRFLFGFHTCPISYNSSFGNTESKSCDSESGFPLLRCFSGTFGKGKRRRIRHQTSVSINQYKVSQQVTSAIVFKTYSTGKGSWSDTWPNFNDSFLLCPLSHDTVASNHAMCVFVCISLQKLWKLQTQQH